MVALMMMVTMMVMVVLLLMLLLCLVVVVVGGGGGWWVLVVNCRLAVGAAARASPPRDRWHRSAGGRALSVRRSRSSRAFLPLTFQSGCCESPAPSAPRCPDCCEGPRCPASSDLTRQTLAPLPPFHL